MEIYRQPQVLARILVGALLSVVCFQITAMDLDQAFNPPLGFVVDPAGSASTACFAAVVRSNSRILVSGYETVSSGSDLLLLGLNSDGKPDTRFGNGGRVGIDVGENDVTYALTMLPDGKILLAGSTSETNNADALAIRLLADGRTDPSFGEKGMVRLGGVGSVDHALAVSSLKDNGALIAGWCQDAESPNMCLWALTEAGLPISGFGDAGRFTYDSGNEDIGTALRVLNDGRILVAGRSHNGKDLDALLLRLKPDGKLDSSFGLGGVVRFDSGVDEALYALEVLPDGRVLAAGEQQGADGPLPLLLTYDSDGRGSAVDLGSELHGQVLDLVHYDKQGVLLSGSLEGPDGQPFQVLELAETEAGWSLVGVPSVARMEGIDKPTLATAIVLQSDGRAVVSGYIGRDDTTCFVMGLRP